MSIIIKGMKMPKREDGRELTLRIMPDGSVIDVNGNRMTDVEAKELPPHGDLIDRGALQKYLIKKAEDDWNKSAAPYSWAYAYECISDTLDIFPPVIEAEEGRRMTLAKAVKTLRDYCASRESCRGCNFEEGGEIFVKCALEHPPEKWNDPPETNLYDEEETHENCTVQILRNSITGETSVGWWENKEAEG